VVQVLAQEMSAELQSLRARVELEARRQGRDVEVALMSRGVAFGVLRVAADGTVDTSGVEGVDSDLVIRPFGWKGTFATLRDFVNESLQVHLGIQSTDLVRDPTRHADPELVGSGTDPDDPDEDGVRDELTAGQLTSLISFLAMQELPIVRPAETLQAFPPVAKNIAAPTATVFLEEWSRGKQLFDELECSTCHVPRIVLKDPVFRTRSASTGEVLQIDLSRAGARPRLQYDPRLRGYPVWLFSDLKRHDLGEKNASRHVDHGVPRQVYLTRRLWGLANSAPYFYDGHAPWFDQAIAAHGGEAETSATAYAALTCEDRGALRVYLLSLRRGRRLVVP
jgi:DNA-directed RNA polymerase subunit H (RpoH/RPB5)